MDSENSTNKGGRPRTRSGAIRTALPFWREERGLTQGGLAQIAGVPQSRLSSWEGGYALPTWTELDLLAKALRVTIADLYSEDIVRALRANAEVA